MNEEEQEQIKEDIKFNKNHLKWILASVIVIIIFLTGVSVGIMAVQENYNKYVSQNKEWYDNNCVCKQDNTFVNEKYNLLFN